MKSITLAGALALAATLLPAHALADDPNDPLLSHSAAARARDRAEIRRLNLRQLAHVRQRDAAYAREWQAWRDYHENRDDYASRQRDHERDMAEWRHAVAACRAGDRDACAR